MATRNYVLQRCVRVRSGTFTWQTVCFPVTYREGLAQLDAVREHHRDHRLLKGVVEAMSLGSIVTERATQ